jgi:hypothetical protein
MAKQQANGFMKVAWVLEAGIADPEFPTAAELNAGLDLSAAIAWEDYEVGSTGSDDIEDRAITDLGNAISRGSANYGATLDFFRDADNTDVTSIYVDAFEAFRVTRVVGYLVTRIADKPAGDAFAAGDTVSVYKLMATTTTDVTGGDTSTKFQVTFLPQGELYTHTMVAGAGAITVAAALALGVGEVGNLAPTLDGESIKSRATYSSSAPAVATVSNHGVVTGVSAGAATITTSYGAGTSGTTSVTVT